MHIDQQAFDDAVRSLAIEDGAEHLLSVPGIWELLTEYYNNAAIAAVIQAAADEHAEDTEGSDTDLIPYYQEGQDTMESLDPDRCLMRAREQAAEQAYHYYHGHDEPGL